MRMPRFGIKAVMAGVVTVAITLGGWKFLERRRTLLARADYHAGHEAWLLEEVTPGAPGYLHHWPASLSQLARDPQYRREMLDYHARLKSLYQHAADRPWVVIGPEPPQPPMPIRPLNEASMTLD